LGLSGIEQLRIFLSGKVEFPPISFLTGMRLTEVGMGTATFVMPITPWLLTPQGVITGGEVAILANGPLGCAIQTALPRRPVIRLRSCRSICSAQFLKRGSS
jgi:acyl-coenzyme A thioesterase PaaI-like protein